MAGDRCEPSSSHRLDLASLAVMKSRVLLAVAALLAVLGVSGLVSTHLHGDQLSSARADARAARQFADARTAESIVAQAAADSATARADRAEHRASVSEARAATLKESYLKLAAVAPDTCRPVIAAADSVLAQKDSANAQLHDSNRNLRVALDTVQTALTRLRGATRDLSAATARLETASRGSLLSRLLPRPSLGVSAGVDLRGRPNVLTGITLGWTF